jgi:hypothetical protein
MVLDHQPVLWIGAGHHDQRSQPSSDVYHDDRMDRVDAPFRHT